jgi:hypothetical protein
VDCVEDESWIVGSTESGLEEKGSRMKIELEELERLVEGAKGLRGR